MASCLVVALFPLATTISAKSFSLSIVTDQASDGNFCNSIYTCSLSDQELSNLNTQDNQGYQIKDHTGLFANGAWPQIYFTPDRYLMFDFEDPNLLSTDTILSSNLIISHQVNEVQGSKGLNYDIKLEISKDNGSTWEVLSTNLWPATPNNYSTSQVSLPASYLNATSLNNLLTRLSIYGDDGYANLSSIIDLIKLDIDYYNTLTNSPPVSTISAPNENQVLKGEITFSASATDDFGITEYQLNLLDENQNLVITCLQATIYSTTSISISCQINTNNYSNGQYYLQVKTKDNAGEWTTTIRPVTFDNISSTTSTTTTSETSSDDTSDASDPLTDLTTLVNSADSAFSSPYSWQPTEVSPAGGRNTVKDSPGVAEVKEVLGKTTTEKPKTWMLILSIFISFSYLFYLLSRRRKI
ncbi:hypothetical protein KJ953_04725 [Patescibacteria group bacterium]|nr:hypothetical protein [Patescibacteria group bacterium]MBU1256128.1 hypothetical protein [Patescibacteria group bacterium]MBU1457324.1 hypothetical protein [Patescibacteria group bacterium]